MDRLVVTIACPEWISKAQVKLHRPEWDAARDVSMAAAARAQALLVIWQPTDPTPPPAPAPGRIVAIVGLPGVEALAAMGLTPVNEGGL